MVQLALGEEARNRQEAPGIERLGAIQGDGGEEAATVQGECGSGEGEEGVETMMSFVPSPTSAQRFPLGFIALYLCC